MSHELFVFTSYGVSLLVVIIMLVWVVLDGRARKAELARLEAQGIKRRSEQG